MTAKEAELNAAAVLRSWGYLDAQSPSHGADGGIDVTSSRALAQVKMRSVKAGRPEIQNLVGAREADKSKALMYFDYKGYSPQAVDYANRMGVGLYVLRPQRSGAGGQRKGQNSHGHDHLDEARRGCDESDIPGMGAAGTWCRLGNSAAADGKPPRGEVTEADNTHSNAVNRRLHP
jgi:hypothetical protein